LAIDRGGRRFLVADVNFEAEGSTIASYDLETGADTRITTHGNRVSAIALDPTGTIAVTGSFNGAVRVGPVTGEEPHLLYGHTLEVTSVSVSPDGKWIASGSQDGTIRLWPMPMGKPFHTVPYEEILERIRALTNLRVVPDQSSDTGYRVEIGHFPGWKKLPDW
jgi:WD40 repeat protein